MGIKEPGLWILVKPISREIPEITMRYEQKRERKTRERKRAILSIISTYLQSFEREIQPPFSHFRPFVYAF